MSENNDTRRDGDNNEEKRAKRPRVHKTSTNYQKVERQQGSGSGYSTERRERRDNGERRSGSHDGQTSRSYNRDGQSGRSYNRDGQSGEGRSYNRDGKSGRSYSSNKSRSANSESGEERQSSRGNSRKGQYGSDRSGQRNDRKRPFNRNNRNNQNPNQQNKKVKTPPPEPKYDGTTRLNKYISNAGICSRRDADKLIAAGAITVNGEVVTIMGYKVKEGDVVTYAGEVLKSEPKRYFLLNKPKGYITTLDDPQERETVMMLIEGACKERIYPVGRLDRNTTGLLLFTNDGEMSKKLTHPSTGVYKIYQVNLDKPVAREDMRRMLEGIELEDGPIKVDDVQYVVDPSGQVDKRCVGVELHSGKNRIVRRIFESLGYEVLKLDRTVFAGLTKKDLPRGRYRELNQQEINYLRMI